MAVRPGQHVSGEGRIYHPYLACWRRQERPSISELLRILQDVFAREPPVISKQERLPNPPRPPLSEIGGAPPVPPLPPELERGASRGQRVASQSSFSEGPPPPPPKPFNSRMFSNPPQENGAPPITPHPKPTGNQYHSPIDRYPNNHVQNARGIDLEPQYALQLSSTLRDGSGPPLSHISDSQGHMHQGQRQNSHGPISPVYSVQSPYSTYSHQQPQPVYNEQQQQQQQQQQQSFTYQNHRPQYSNHLPNPQANPRPPPSKPPTADLLTSPFDNPLPLQQTNIPAPPIPPNPEKDALLSSLSRTILRHLSTTLASNASALPPLQAQNSALQTTLQNLQHEQHSLNALNSLLLTNESILHAAMRSADTVIADAAHRTVPGVDEVLVAPTVVGEQLYELVAEERACVEARAVLGRALDVGRVSCEGWVRGVRGLAREEFLKKVLVRKCARGMGLVEGEEGWE
ncbi:hypothetical protein MMC06_003344 [Schaereria dolodes]|nr:hypothetical protein [Schaereria dolodes]